MTPALAEAQDRAHLLVSRLMHGERDAVAAEMAQLDDMDALRVCLVLLDLCCFIHARHCDAQGIVGELQHELWQQILVEVAAWRELAP